MKKTILFIIIAITITNCKPKNTPLKNYTSEVLKTTAITEHVYTHTSYLKTKSSGVVPCNGMVYIHEDEAIIFDTPTNKKAATELVKWLGKKKVKAVIVTHFHIDCLGSLEVFHTHGIPSFATNKTIKLAKSRNNKPLPKNGFDNQKDFFIGNKLVYAKYFGEGHTADNIIGYVPSEKALFGGCLIKHLNAKKGNLADANINAWSKTVRNLKEEIPEIKIVIPGHGENGNTELLDYTIKLFLKN